MKIFNYKFIIYLVDFEQIMNSRKTKEVGRKRKLTGRTDIMENPLARE